MRTALITTVIVMVASCSGAPPDYGANVGPEPDSLSDVSGLGGGSWELLTLDEIAALADGVLEVEVVDVMKTRLNTHDGRFPTSDELEQFGLRQLVPLTDVKVKVVRSVATSSPDLRWDKGEELIITVGGGLYETVLDQRQARLLGITDAETPETLPDHTEGESSPPDVETEVPVESDAVPFSWGTSPEGLRLTEGETVVLFVHEVTIGGYLSPQQTYLGVIHPRGVLSPSNGQWVDPLDGRPVDLDALVVGVS